jgi:prepilin-type N-terminal cleavage/methylation domain-containing protein
MPRLRTLNVRFGFTLIEFLVVLGVLAVAVGSALLFLTSILRGTNQANVTAEVKQNGQAVLDSLDAQIRNAKDVQCIDSGGAVVDCSSASASSKYIGLLMPSGNPLHIKCFSDSTPKTVNGWIGTAVATTVPTDASFTPVTGQDLVSGVDINNCNFVVSPSTAGTLNPAVVSLSFVVNQGINAPSRQDFQANVQFQTTISLRQY